MISLLQVQDVVPITSYDTAGSFLLLGCNNGSIYYIGEWQARTGSRPRGPSPTCSFCMRALSSRSLTFLFSRYAEVPFANEGQ